MLFGWSGNTVRLVNGVSNFAGRVEVYINGAWKSVCDKRWYLSDARVVCKQLGFNNAVLNYSNAFFGKGSGIIGMEKVRCTGKESSLFDCTEGEFTLTRYPSHCFASYHLPCNSCKTVRCFMRCHKTCRTVMKRISVCGHAEDVGVLCVGGK